MDTSRPSPLPLTSLDSATKLCNQSFDLSFDLFYARSGPKCSMRLQGTHLKKILTSDLDSPSNFALGMTSKAFSSNDFACLECLPGVFACRELYR